MFVAAMQTRVMILLMAVVPTRAQDTVGLVQAYISQGVVAHVHEHEIERQAVWAERIGRQQANNSIHHGGLSTIDHVGGYYKCNGKTSKKLFVSKNSWMTKPANDKSTIADNINPMFTFMEAAAMQLCASKGVSLYLDWMGIKDEETLDKTVTSFDLDSNAGWPAKLRKSVIQILMDAIKNAGPSLKKFYVAKKGSSGLYDVPLGDFCKSELCAFGGERKLDHCGPTEVTAGKKASKLIKCEDFNPGCNGTPNVAKFVAAIEKAL